MTMGVEDNLDSIRTFPVCHGSIDMTLEGDENGSVNDSPRDS
jgi:hypothetical protein